mmetsp:Transcript_40919/g.49656  ORF Transcript_40919/g.49656 Transcript_40919/m.49656 type:complete len:362 (-) Transcript_40919:39-1124(-)
MMKANILHLLLYLLPLLPGGLRFVCQLLRSTFLCLHQQLRSLLLLPHYVIHPVLLKLCCELKLLIVLPLPLKFRFFSCLLLLLCLQSCIVQPPLQLPLLLLCFIPRSLHCQPHPLTGSFNFTFLLIRLFFILALLLFLDLSEAFHFLLHFCLTLLKGSLHFFDRLLFTYFCCSYPLFCQLALLLPDNGFSCCLLCTLLLPLSLFLLLLFLSSSRLLFLLLCERFDLSLTLLHFCFAFTLSLFNLFDAPGLTLGFRRPLSSCNFLVLFHGGNHLDLHFQSFALLCSLSSFDLLDLLQVLLNGFIGNVHLDPHGWSPRSLAPFTACSLCYRNPILSGIAVTKYRKRCSLVGYAVKVFNFQKSF